VARLGFVRYYDDILQLDGTIKRVQICKKLNVVERVYLPE
jgi:hypothetical protein